MTSPAVPELAVRAVGLYVPVLATVALGLHRWRGGNRPSVGVASDHGGGDGPTSPRSSRWRVAGSASAGEGVAGRTTRGSGRADARRLTAALLASAWNVPALLAVNAVAQRAGWWRFEVEAATVAGLPIDLWLGWVLLWGAIPVLVGVDRLRSTVPVLVAVDLVAMPLMEPVVQLGRWWLVGEAVAVAVVLVPGLLLGRWTALGQYVGRRAALQAVAFAGLLLYVIPSLALTATGDSWHPLLERPAWQLALGAAVAGPPGLVALAAVRAFAVHGCGTPVPLDPPLHLVTRGPYAHVANPMQIGATVVLVVWGVMLASPAVVATGLLAAAFSSGIAAWIEDRELTDRFGPAWLAYRQHVRLWLPRRGSRARSRRLA